MNQIKADLTQPIILGRQGEHGITQVVFDLSWYAKTYGDGVAQLTVKRPGDPLEYMGVLTQDGTTAVWEISPEWTETHGQGYCYLHWLVDDKHAKTDTYKTVVYESQSACDAPEPQKGYLDRIVDAGVQAVRAEEKAKVHAENVQALAKQFDETFSVVVRTAEQNAAEANRQAQQAATAAGQSASAAGQSADNALKSEQEAEKAAELAEGYTSHPPIIGENGNWWEWDGEAYTDTSKPSRGTQGPKGKQGIQGIQGKQGIQGERGPSGVYVGSGDMPEDCNVQIDEDGDSVTMESLVEAVLAEMGPAIGEIETALSRIADLQESYMSTAELDRIIALEEQCIGGDG